MNEEIFKGKWNQFKGVAKQIWGNLTDSDLARVEGSYDEFVGILQERYGWDRARAEREVDEQFMAQRW